MSHYNRSESVEGFEIHHRVPIAQGGNSLLGNLVCLCPDCHKEVHRIINAEYRNIEYERTTGQKKLTLWC